jgi:ribosome-binding factor A
MLQYKRADRVADVIQRELADLLQRRIKDPRLHRITVTGVELSDDLRVAKVFYCFWGESAEQEIVARGLDRARGFIRRELGKRLYLKFLPELDFRYDPSFEYGAKIERILKELQTDE